jgi:cell division protein ZapA
MGQVTISVNGRSYRMACRDGEEKRVAELAAFIESHTTEIMGGLKLVQEDKLFLMAALMVADELWETRDELRRALRHLADLGAIQPVEAPAPVVRDRPRAAGPVRLNAKAAQTA